MTKEKFTRLGGLSLILAGVTILVGLGVGGMYQTRFGATRDFETIQGVLWAAVPLLFATGLFALKAQYGNKIGRLSNFSLLTGGVVSLISFVGLLFTAVLAYEESAWLFFIFGLLSMSIAIMLFGVDTLRTKPLPKWNNMPFSAGVLLPMLLIAGTLFNSNGENNINFDFFFPVASLGFSNGVILLGYMLQGEGKASEMPA